MYFMYQANYFWLEIELIGKLDNISEILIGQAGIFVIMSIEAFRTDVIVFIVVVMMRATK
jgi:hypothetical protein